MTEFEQVILPAIKKHVKHDEILAKRVFYTCISAYAEPTNLAVLAPTSEGKTYVVLKVADLFPKEDVLSYARISPTSFIHDTGTLIDKAGENIELTVKKRQEEIEEWQAESKDKKNPPDIVRKSELRQLIEQNKNMLKELYADSKKLIDLRNKILIFLEPPYPQVWEWLKPILSHDKFEIEYKVTIPDTLQVKKIVIRGWPSAIFCSAKDESKYDVWEEIASRFDIVSPEMTREKYSAANIHTAEVMGLPEIVVNDESYNELKESAKDYVLEIKRCLLDIKYAIVSETKNESPGMVWNPHYHRLAELFPSESGIRMRQFKRLLINIAVSAFARIKERPTLEIDKIPFIITTFEDLKEAIELSRDYEEIMPYKVRWYTEIFLPAYNEILPAKELNSKLGNHKSEMVGIKSSDIAKYVHKYTAKRISAKKILDRYLSELREYGYIDSIENPSDKRENLWYPVDVYANGRSRGYIDVYSLNFTLDDMRQSFFGMQNIRRKVVIRDSNFNPMSLEDLYPLMVSETNNFALSHELYRYTPYIPPNFYRRTHYVNELLDMQR